jgi:hypothetical protein
MPQPWHMGYMSRAIEKNFHNNAENILDNIMEKRYTEYQQSQDENEDGQEKQTIL